MSPELYYLGKIIWSIIETVCIMLALLDKVIEDGSG